MICVQTCEALVASERLGDRRKPIACPMEWIEHPLLLIWDLELDTQTRAACDYDELQTDPVPECTKWRTSGILCQGAGTILSQWSDCFSTGCRLEYSDDRECASPTGWSSAAGTTGGFPMSSRTWAMSECPLVLKVCNCGAVVWVEHHYLAFDQREGLPSEWLVTPACWCDESPRKAAKGLLLTDYRIRLPSHWWRHLCI